MGHTGTKLFFVPKNLGTIVWKLLKMSHLNCLILAFFHQFLFYSKVTWLVKLFNGKLQKWRIFGAKIQIFRQIEFLDKNWTFRIVRLIVNLKFELHLVLAQQVFTIPQFSSFHFPNLKEASMHFEDQRFMTSLGDWDFVDEIFAFFWKVCLW